MVWGEVQRGKNVNRKVQRVTSLLLFRDLKLELKRRGKGEGKDERKVEESACTQVEKRKNKEKNPTRVKRKYKTNCEID